MIQFAADWTLDGPSAEVYWQSNDLLSGNYERLCELLAREHSLRLRLMSPDDAAGRHQVTEQIESRLKSITQDHAVLRCLHEEIAVLVEIERSDDRGIAPPKSKAILSVLDLFQMKNSLVGASEGERALLGQGGFKTVVLANQHTMARDVVLKFPNDETSVHHVDIEARILRRLIHQNIPPVHGYRENHPGYGNLIVETYVGNETWGQIIRRERDRVFKIANLDQRKAEWDRVLKENIKILRTVCRPVRYAHESHNLVHVDLKPGNVMLRQPPEIPLDVQAPYRFDTAEVYVIDWGEGVFVGEIGDDEGLESRLVHQRPKVSGTPGYRPPELEPVAGLGVDFNQIQDWKLVDTYSLGAILGQLFTGRPIQAETRRGIGFIETELPAELKEARWVPPPELVDIQKKATSLAPAGRFQSVEEFMLALERFLDNAHAVEEIEKAEIRKMDWVERVARREELSGSGGASQREVVRAIIQAGEELAHSFRIPCEQILKPQKLHANLVIPGDQPKVRSSITHIREIWNINLILCREIEEFLQARSVLDKLASLPAQNRAAIDDQRKLIDAADRRRRSRVFLVGAIAAAIPLIILNWSVSLYYSEQKIAYESKATKERAKAVGEGEENLKRQMIGDHFRQQAWDPKFWKMNSAAARLNAQRTIHDDHPEPRIECFDLLSDSLLPQYAGRIFDNTRPEEHFVGTGAFNMPLRFALTINSLSRNSGLLVAAGVATPERLRAWNLDTFRPVESFNKTKWDIPVDKDAWVSGLALSPDEKRLAVGFASGEIRVLEVDTGRLLVRTQAHDSPMAVKEFWKAAMKDFPFLEIGRLEWSQDGKWIATQSGPGNEIRVWNAETLEKELEFPPIGPLFTVAYSPPKFCGPNGRYLAAIQNSVQAKSPQRKLLVMDLLATEGDGAEAKSKPRKIIEHTTAVSTVLSVTADHEGKLLAVGGLDAIEILETPLGAETWKVVRHIPTMSETWKWLRNKSDEIPVGIRQQLLIMDDMAVEMSFSRDRRLLAMTRGDGSLSVISVAHGQVLWSGMGMPPSMAYAENSFPHFTSTGGLYTVGTDGRLLAWDIGGPQFLPAQVLDTNIVSLNAIGADGRFFKSIGRRAITWFEADDPRHPLRLEEQDDARLLHRSQQEFPDDVVRVVSIPQKASAVASLAHGGIVVVDLKTGTHRAFGEWKETETAAQQPVHFAVAVSDDGQYAAGNDSKGGITIVEIGQTSTLATLGKSSVVSIAFRPRRPRELTAITSQGQIETWSLDQPEKPVRVVAPDQLPVTIAAVPDAGQVCYTPDGTQLVAAQGPKIRLFDADSGNLVQDWKGHAPVIFAGTEVVMVNALAFREDGLRFASLAADGKVRLWDRRSTNEEFRSAGAMTLADLKSFQSASELSQFDDKSAIREEHLTTNMVALRFLERNRLFVDTSYCTTRIYDLDNLDAFYAMPAAELVALTEATTGLTIRDPSISVIDGRVVAKDVRVEFSEQVYRPQSANRFVPRIDQRAMFQAILRRDKSNQNGDFAGAEAAITDYLQRNPHVANESEGEYLLRRRAFDRAKQKKFDAALEDCDRILKGFTGWDLQPADELDEKTGLMNGKPVSLSAAYVLNYRAQLLNDLNRYDEAQKAALSTAAWARMVLSRPHSHLYSNEDRGNLTQLLEESTSVAERLLQRQKRPEEAKLVHQKADAVLAAKK